jgi:predicted dinucleotide-binding enzyme
MMIAIIGDGPLARLLATTWDNDRHEVVFALPASSGSSKTLERADIVLLATAWHERLADELASLKPALQGKTLIDSTNPIDDAGKYRFDPDSSFAEMLAQLFPTTTIVKAGNTVSRETLRHVLAKGYPFIHGQPITVFYCGDDAPSKRLAAGLIGETSLEPVDVGPLEMARLLEPVGVFAQKLSDHGPLGHAIALNAVHELSDHSPIDGIM